MSEENVERTREAREAWNRRDFDQVLEGLHPEVEFVRFRATGRGSGLEIDTPFAHTLTFRDERVIRFEAFTDRDAALEAAQRRE
jgi:ketosteroid isomerase-like protein